MRPAERVLTCLNLAAAEVPCETAPFASFSGRTEKEGPARPERVPIEIVLVHFDKTIYLFRHAEGLPQKHAAAPFDGRENKSTEICISTMIDFYWDEAPGKP